MNIKLKIICVICFFSAFYFIAGAGEEKSELKFSHKLHVVENEVECASCHAEAESSKSGADNLMPDMEVCGSCHDVESEESCAICHSDLENPRAVPRVQDNKTFSHEQHLAAKLECKSCHKTVKEKEVVEPYILPALSECQQCHKLKRVKPTTHGPDYLHSHGDNMKSINTAMKADQKCSVCHYTATFCQNCHEGDNIDRTTHPLNYQLTHSLDARGKQNECAVCHMERSFCIECHRQSFVIPHNHTAGWTNLIPGDGGRHRIEAQNDLENCLSCHENNAQEVCQRCHTK